METKNELLLKKFKQYAILTGGIIVAGSKMAHAQIVHTDVNPDFIGGLNTSYDIDFNNDGIIDVTINQAYSTWTGPYATYTYSYLRASGPTGTQFAGANVYDGAKLDFNNEIGQGSILTNWSSTTLVNSWGWGEWIGINDDKFLGVKFEINGAVHYGWIKLSNQNDTQFTVKEFAYDNTAGTSIYAGRRLADIANQTFNINENSINGAVVNTVVASDPDGYALTYSIEAGNTGNTFAISPTTGEITVNDSTLLDFETNPTFNLTVKVTDAGIPSDSTTALITINVNDISEVPTIAAQTFNIDENALNGTVVNTVVATELDAADTHTYSITAGNTGNTFAINSATGEITVNDSTLLDFETNPSFTLTVEVADNEVPSKSSSAAVTINVNDINEVPTIAAQSFNVDENSLNGTVVNTVVAADQDANNLAYSITAGNTGNTFAINPATGEITVNDNTLLNYENINSFSLTVEVEDDGVPVMSSSSIVTININDVNESPVIANQSFTVDGTSSNGTVVGTVIATDPDAGQTLSYSITSGNTGNVFAIDPLTGEITVNDATQFDQATTIYNVIVQVIDDNVSALSSSATVTINVDFSTLNVKDVNASSNVKVWSYGKQLNVGGLNFSDENEIKVYNMTGALVYQKENLNTENTFDMQNLNIGMYIVHVKSGEINTKHKVILK